MNREILYPNLDLISEQHVLVQAWKKTANHIRFHNWYADTLELDISSARLPKFIEMLQHDLRNGNKWSNDLLLIVPAPKSHPWVIKGKKWQPEKGRDVNKNIRPLA